MKLSAHFTLEELTFSERAIREGIDNTPTQEVKDNLWTLATDLLEPIRYRVGLPIIVNSGYRSPALNAATPGASKRSDHMRGIAADIRCASLSAATLMAEIVAQSAGLPIKQLILEFGGWVHASYDLDAEAPEYLVATNPSSPVYTKWINPYV